MVIKHYVIYYLAYLFSQYRLFHISIRLIDHSEIFIDRGRDYKCDLHPGRARATAVAYARAICICRALCRPAGRMAIGANRTLVYGSKFALYARFFYGVSRYVLLRLGVTNGSAISLLPRFAGAHSDGAITNWGRATSAARFRAANRLWAFCRYTEDVAF